MEATTATRSLITGSDIKERTSVKLKLTKNGYEATVKADDPLTAVAKAAEAHGLLVRMRDANSAPGSTDSRALPILVMQDDGYLVLQTSGGAGSLYNPALQQIAEDYRVKIDLTLNSKGLSWEITVKAVNPEWGVALIGYTESALAAALLTEGGG